VGRLQDWFDVPEQTFQTKFLELTAEQKEAIKEATLEFPEPMTLIGKKHQIENGLLVGDEYSSEKNFKNAKIEVLKDLAYEFDKMIVFAKYTAQINLIARELGKDTKVLVMDGRTKDKGAIINEAKGTNGRCVLIVQSSISAGWELPQFSVMVFASMTNSYVDREQGEGRILRSNAIKKNLYIDLVVKGGIDEAVYNSIKNKKDFNERIYAEAL
jgi:superfamily II DNA or RNA helicase